MCFNCCSFVFIDTRIVPYLVNGNLLTLAPESIWGNKGWVSQGRLERLAIFTLGKVHLRPKDITRNEKYHFVMINELIHQDNITMLNVFAPNNKVLKYIKKKKRSNLKEK